MSRYTLAYVGFDAQQQESIDAVLYFAASALEDEWETVVAATDSDISVINLDTENGTQLLQEQQKIKADYRLVLVAEKLDFQFENYWTLEKKALAPVSLRKLTELLNQVSSCLTAISVAPADDVQAMVQQFMVGNIQDKHVERATEAKLAQGKLPKEESSVRQALPEFDLNMMEEQRDEGAVELVIPELNIEQLGMTPEEERTPQALVELDVLVDEDPLQLSEPDKLSGVAEQQEYAFELDLDSVLIMAGGDAQQDVSEFAAKVFDDLDSAQQEKITPEVKINLPTRTLSVKTYFFGVLQLALKDKACRIIRLADLPLLYILPDNNQYYFQGTDNQLLQFMVAEPKQLKIRTIKKVPLEKLLAKADDLHSWALDALFVRAVLLVSQGRLLKGHRADRKVELKTWQDNVDISQLDEYAELATFMQKKPHDLYTVAESLQIPLAIVFDFYNICYLLGCIRILPEEVGQERLPVKSKKTLGYFLRSFFKGSR